MFLGIIIYNPSQCRPIPGQMHPTFSRMNIVRKRQHILRKIFGILSSHFHHHPLVLSINIKNILIDTRFSTI